MAPTPYEPNIDERDNYYLGFSGRPRLIARTGGDRWSKLLEYSPYYIPNGSRQIEKSLAVISDPETISKWSRDLDQSLMKALNQFIWTRFFPIRIGLVDPEQRRGWRKKICNLSTVLLIAVEKGSLEWQQGIQIALECRTLLKSYGIDNIEVEICEGSHSRQVACTRLETQIETQIERGLSQQDKDTNEVVLNMLVPTGYPIAYLDGIAGQGTVGLHIRLEGKDSKFYGLTCRHVVSHGREPHESYICSEDNRQYHVQGNIQHLDDIHFRLTQMNKELKADLNTFQTKHE
ncbi:hypothetical protein E8E14_002992 [Neopestalotiopsis sp. 37M]|nr:hypothetical protein E8E14_002992 [Neopestalotiopsis sp. 37M]